MIWGLISTELGSLNLKNIQSSWIFNMHAKFLEELVEGKEPDVKHIVKPVNKKIKFSYSDSEEEDEDGNGNENGQKDKVVIASDHETQLEDKQEDGKNEDESQPEKKQKCTGRDESECEEVIKSKSVDQLIDAELDELKDKTKRRFNYLDTGCNGVVFVQINKRGEKDPTPKEIAESIITSAATTRRHMSRFILRVLPIELTCYASEEEISRAIKPLIAQYFPIDPQTPYKFAVLCEARANSGLDRMKIINAVAKSIPEPHKVDLTNPDRTIVVQIAKTVCCIGVVEKYKELAKYNLRQLTSSKQ
ncbi:hypothetical protein E3N88_00263 [Mikania micrantha]|uniref:THUMP domain-containing protein n=1 Tax=Mikania micrantha TaxID=192012 RepID=A0A5N6PZ11_9ASTR|nr:hypothetical protein E3N88_00263 [Mikania micrantha]